MDQNQIIIFGTISSILISTISLTFSIYNILRDKSKIKIDYNKNIRKIDFEGIYDDKKYFQISVTNRGRRPIKIDRAGVRIINSNKPKLLFSDGFVNFKNKILNEENPTIYFLAENSLIDFNKAWYIFVYDGFGNEYKKYFSKLPTFWRIYKLFKK